AAANNLTQFTAVQSGPAGSTITVAYVAPQAPNQPLSVSVTGTAITVSLATDGAGKVSSTPAQITQAINSNPQARALVAAQVIGTATGLATPLAPTNLVVVQASHVALFANGGNDTLTAIGGSDISLFGGSGDDCLVAEGGSDITLFGGSGSDTLTATGGTDLTLFGGSGGHGLLQASSALRAHLF